MIIAAVFILVMMFLINLLAMGLEGNLIIVLGVKRTKQIKAVLITLLLLSALLYLFSIPGV